MIIKMIETLNEIRTNRNFKVQKRCTIYDLHSKNKRPEKKKSSPMVMADCCGMSMAISLRLWTYLTLSTMGTRTLRPGSRMRLYLPILSTIQASCCGTNITTVLIGVLCFHRIGARCGIVAVNWS